MTTDAPDHDLGNLRPGEVLLGKYRINRVIGQGGMGVVVEAWHLQLDERVAIKLLLPELSSNEEAVARFQREARALFKIKSENVCRVMDIGTMENGVPFMVMEYLDGKDLATVLETRPQLSVQWAVDTITQACFGMAEAHRRGLVHRDLKPENLFVCKGVDGQPSVKLLDFGLSKERQRPEERKRALTQQQQVMGTPHYMAPEQWMSAKDVGATADQWALGIMLYEMLAGAPPFDGEQLAQICSQTLNAPIPSLQEIRPDLPRGLEAVLHKCLEKNPHHRYESVGALVLALSPFAPSGVGAKAERVVAMLRASVDVIEDSTPLVPSRAPLAASDMQVTVRRPPAIGDLVQRVRSVTSQSWNSALRKAATRSRLAVAAGIVAVGAMVFVSVIILSNGGGEAVLPPDATPPRVAAPAEPEPSGPTAQATDEETPPELATPPASASASASAKAAAKPAPPRPRPRATAPTTTPKHPVDKHGDLFDERY